METSDFLQADDINKVILVPFAVAAGNDTDDAIEAFIGTNSLGRQGRYYRLAAEKFGLVFNKDNLSYLTSDGQIFIGLKNNRERIEFIARKMRKMRVFSQAISFLESSNPRPSLENLKNWFIQSYPGSNNTADRRFSTFEKYLRETGFI